MIAEKGRESNDITMTKNNLHDKRVEWLNQYIP